MNWLDVTGVCATKKQFHSIELCIECGRDFCEIFTWCLSWSQRSPSLGDLLFELVCSVHVVD